MSCSVFWLTDRELTDELVFSLLSQVLTDVLIPATMQEMPERFVSSTYFSAPYNSAALSIYLTFMYYCQISCDNLM